MGTDGHGFLGRARHSVRADVVKVNALTGNRRRAEDCPPCLDIVTLHRCSFVPVRGQDFGQSFYRLG